MVGRELLVDTNIIIYLLQGNDEAEKVLQGKQLFFSFITELELYGLPGANNEEEKQIEAFLNDCLMISMNNNILQQYKALRKSHKLKLADSLIAATALAYNIPLITADKQFINIEHLKLIQFKK